MNCRVPTGAPVSCVHTRGGEDATGFRALLINADKFRADSCTMLHEMMHAATGLGEPDHDQDESHLFSGGSNRSVLRSEHPKALSQSFFATPSGLGRPRA
jgi:hypothetical protein